MTPEGITNKMAVTFYISDMFAKAGLWELEVHIVWRWLKSLLKENI